MAGYGASRQKMHQSEIVLHNEDGALDSLMGDDRWQIKEELGYYDGDGSVTWPESGIRLSFDCSPECTHLVVYNPPFPIFAMEPVTNANNGINLYAAGSPTSGVVVLEPGERLTAQFSLRVDVAS